MQIVADNTYRPTTSYVKCIGAETQFYKTGQRYKVFKKEGDEKGRYVQGSDGIFDRIGMTVSKFKAEEK
ncbi:hypothetical protein KNU84_gp055 [Bacteriophage DSS3_VP1]|uniref:Uncharacterized protein n=1 Tax=Bacteriophage DSS3_VP1 TaxID=2664196 RepID=A0A7S5FQD0_9CAUD|nr:hypothetical protein KNU84_gp055 [Bacteriophage DSS3_VP1]QGH74649.1 hypothetical protein DSS3VP1_00081 [Bacteriophage DSS3_VP1]